MRTLLSLRVLFFLVFLLVAGCRGGTAKHPNPTRPLEERRALTVIVQAYKDVGTTPAGARDIRLPSGRPLRVDVGTQGHHYGVAFLTGAEHAQLDAKVDLPPRAPGGDLPVVQGAGADLDAVVLLLFAEDYQDDDLAGERHETTAVTSERRLTRDVRDFLAQARLRNLP